MGLDRNAAALLVIQSDEPGATAGAEIETVEALIPAVNPKAGFVRFRWNPQ